MRRTLCPYDTSVLRLLLGKDELTQQQALVVVMESEDRGAFLRRREQEPPSQPTVVIECAAVRGAANRHVIVPAAVVIGQVHLGVR